MFFVKCNDPADGTAVAISATIKDAEGKVTAHIPAPFEPHPTAIGAVVTGIDVDPVSGSPLHFDVLVEYSVIDPNSDTDPLTGRRYSWIRVIPVIDDHAVDILDPQPAFRFDDDPTLSYHSAREVNNVQGIHPGTFVLLQFIGYDSDDNPAYVFQYGGASVNGNYLPPHDHRDNLGQSGGFAFSVWHPGTGLPQAPMPI